MKKRKVFIPVLFAFFIAVIGAGYYFVYAPKVNAAGSDQEIVLEEGQEILYAKITSISGNEMSYTVLEEQTIDLEEMGNGKRRNGSAPNAGRRSMNGEKSSDNAQSKTITTYIETEKTGQIQIPVGTDVETKLGTITTFSRLSNGDTIKMLLQKMDGDSEELLKIWIVE